MAQCPQLVCLSVQGSDCDPGTFERVSCRQLAALIACLPRLQSLSFDLPVSVPNDMRLMSGHIAPDDALTDIKIGRSTHVLVPAVQRLTAFSLPMRDRLQTLLLHLVPRRALGRLADNFPCALQWLRLTETIRRSDESDKRGRESLGEGGQPKRVEEQETASFCS